ncbi:hypothetical protein B0H13DRAFT_1865117 [Mycena leptocephala]|nr:hypothetical protein B0H13DRAFT_1865117 [Mycena leptocephala]
MPDPNGEVDDIMIIDDPTETIESAESAVPAVSTQSMDDRVMGSRTSLDLDFSRLLAFMVPHSPTYHLVVPVRARLTLLQLAESLMNNFPPLPANDPVAHLLLQTNKGIAVHLRILQNRSRLHKSLLTIESNVQLQKQLLRASRVNSQLLSNFSGWRSQTSGLESLLQTLSFAINSTIESTLLPTSIASSTSSTSDSDEIPPIVPADPADFGFEASEASGKVCQFPDGSVIVAEEQREETEKVEEAPGEVEAEKV